MEKDLVLHYGITWAEANGFLKAVRQQLGADNNAQLVYDGACQMAAKKQEQNHHKVQAQETRQQQEKAAEAEHKANRGRYISLQKIIARSLEQQHAAKKFILRGKLVSESLVQAMNQDLREDVQYTNGAKLDPFTLGRDGQSYVARMNHQCMLYHEEDVMCCLLETMEDFGFSYRVHYDFDYAYAKGVGKKEHRAKEVFLFSRPPVVPSATAAAVPLLP